MQNSAIKIVADLNKVAEHIQSLKIDLIGDKMLREDKMSLKNTVEDLIKQLEQLKRKYSTD